MKRCAWYRWRWSVRRDAGRPPEPLLLRHLTRCAACRDWVAAAERVEQAMAEPRPTATLAREDAMFLWRQVAARTHSAVSSRLSRPSSRRSWIWVAIGAAAAAVVLVLWPERFSRAERNPELARMGLAAVGEVVGWANRLGHWNEQPTAELGRVFADVLRPLWSDVRPAFIEWRMPADADAL